MAGLSDAAPRAAEADADADAALRDAPATYRYDPHLGNARDRYARVDFTRTRTHQPEIAGRFVARVEGETVVTSLRGRRPVAWRAEPGTPCIILGSWSDGTVHVKWRSPNQYYTLDGRFPAWVVAEDPTAKMAGGGRVLDAHDPGPLPMGMSAALARNVLLALVLLALVVWLLLSLR